MTGRDAKQRLCALVAFDLSVGQGIPGGLPESDDDAARMNRAREATVDELIRRAGPWWERVNEEQLGSRA